MLAALNVFGREVRLFTDVNGGFADCEITEDIHARPGTERTVRDDEAAKTMNEAGRKLRNKKKKN